MFWFSANYYYTQIYPITPLNQIPQSLGFLILNHRFFHIRYKIVNINHFNMKNHEKQNQLMLEMSMISTNQLNIHHRCERMLLMRLCRFIGLAER
ncbi:hypothetical protein Hanom_Chr00s000003g01605811 [Helianthus anomalus]